MQIHARKAAATRKHVYYLICNDVALFPNSKKETGEVADCVRRCIMQMYVLLDATRAQKVLRNDDMHAWHSTQCMFIALNKKSFQIKAHGDKRMRIHAVNMYSFKQKQKETGQMHHHLSTLRGGKCIA